MSSKIFFTISIIILFLTRFFGFNWGNGFYFHPDENNMAMAIAQFSDQNLNPHFFAYGQFPLYLGYFTLKLLNIPNTFENSIIVLRLWSAVFSVTSVFVLYKIYSSKIFLLLLIFTPGLIQLSHFGTTEALLMLVFVSSLYLAINKPKYFLLYSLILGIGIASKISALIFIVPYILTNLKKPLNIFLTILLSLSFGFVLSPFNILSFSDFKSAMQYETSVATGKTLVFYTIQFKNSLPYLFQITKIFPYVAGLPIFILSLISLSFIHKSYFLNRKSIIILISVLVYFLYFGQLYVKWTRFMSPVFFIFPLLAAFAISRQKKILQPFLTIISLIPGVIMFSQYFRPDIRLEATNWMITNIPQNSTIFSESGNVVNLPLYGNFSVDNFDFYNNTPNGFESYDYILIPSRRVFKNYNYDYYQKLFDGSLGFVNLKTFAPPEEFFLKPENAEETWSVFDRPTIRLFSK